MRRQRGRCVIHSPTIDVDAAPKTPPGDDADVKDLRATPAADGYKYVLRSTGHALPRRTTVTRSTRGYPCHHADRGLRHAGRLTDTHRTPQSELFQKISLFVARRPSQVHSNSPPARLGLALLSPAPTVVLSKEGGAG